MVEIQLRLKKAFAGLIARDRDVFGADARRHSAAALKRAEEELRLKEEKQAVRTLAAKISQAEVRGTAKG